MTKGKTKKQTATPFQFNKDCWLILPLIGLAGFSVYSFFDSLQNHFSFGYPTSALLITAFCLFYSYRVMKQPIDKYAKLVAYIFAVMFIIGVVLMLSGIMKQCGGLDALQEMCSVPNQFKVWFIMFNPFILPLWGAFAVGGLVALIVKFR